MGRPTRIDLSDCDTPVPTAEDAISLSAGVSAELAAKYLPQDVDHILPHMWESLLETTFALGSILHNHYKARLLDQHPMTLVSQDQDRLKKCRRSFPTEEACENRVVLLHLYHLCVYHE